MRPFLGGTFRSSGDVTWSVAPSASLLAGDNDGGDANKEAAVDGKDEMSDVDSTDEEDEDEGDCEDGNNEDGDSGLSPPKICFLTVAASPSERFGGDR